MAKLKNDRHEQFAIILAKGKSSVTAAYLKVYPKSTRAAAASGGHRLMKSAEVSARITELQRPAIAEAVASVGVSVERIVQELERIAFSDIRKAVYWRNNLIEEKDSEDGGDVLVIRHIFSNHVMLIDSDKISDDVAAAIKSITQTKEGVKIVFHDKSWALKLLAQYKGMIDGDKGETTNIQQNNYYAPVDRPLKETYDAFAQRRQRELGQPIKLLETGVGAPARPTNGRDHSE